MIQETADSLSAALNGRLGFINQGAGRPEIRVYGGSRPASPALAPDTALLAAVELQDPAGSVSAGVLTLLPYAAGTVVNSGAPTWARLVNGDGATVFDMDAGTSPGKECQLSKAYLSIGGSVSVLSATLG